MTFEYRDVPFSDNTGVVKNILAGVCDHCKEVISIPPQSTPAIKAQRQKATNSVEAVLPAIYLEALDLACFRIDPQVPQDFRKRLLMYYIYSVAQSEAAIHRIGQILNEAKPEFAASENSAKKSRLSLKVSEAISAEIEKLMQATSLNKTDLLKALVLQIDEDIIAPKEPANLEQLRVLAAVASC
jgi:hypothetical protein